MFTEELLGRELDRAKWVRYHVDTRRLMVWRGGEQVEVLDVSSARLMDKWPCKATVESAAATIEERLNKGY